MEWITSEDLSTAEHATAQYIAARLAQAVEERGAATLAISGGSTPWGMFERLAAQQLPWNEVRVVQVDERIAAPDHAARNWRRFLASPLARRIASVNQYPMPVEVDDPRLAADRYAETLIGLAGAAIVLDVVHLGLGEDGHTASLFIDDPLFRETRRPVGVSQPHQGFRRLSLTLPVINGARCVVWFVVGAARRAAVTRLFRRDPSIPASHVERERGACFTDRDAAPDA